MSLPVTRAIVTVTGHNNAFPDSISHTASIRILGECLDSLLHPQAIVLSSRIFQIASCDCSEIPSAHEEAVASLAYSIRSVG